MAYNPSTPAKEIFGANASCILAPDNANGPYFVSQEISKQSSSQLDPYRERTCATSLGRCSLSHFAIERLQFDETFLGLRIITRFSWFTAAIFVLLEC